MYSLCVIRINSLDAPGDDHQPVIAQAGGQRQQRVAGLHIDFRRLNGIPAQGIDVGTEIGVGRKAGVRVVIHKSILPWYRIDLGTSGKL